MSGFTATSFAMDEPMSRGAKIRLVDEDSTAEERTWATLMHLGGFSGFIWGPLAIVVPLVMWLVKRGKSPFIDDHGKEAVNFQISVWLWVLISMILIICLIGIPMLIVLPFFWIIMSIVMAVRSNRGEYVRYPMTFRFIK